MGIEPLGLIAAGSVAGGLVAAAMVGVAWTNRERPAAVPFGWLMPAISGWCFFSAAQMLANSPSEAYLFDRLVRIAAANAAPLAVVFVLAYAGHDEWLTPRWFGLLWAFPAIYVGLSLTAPVHGLASVPGDVTIRTVGGITAAVVPIGLAKTLHIAFAYVVVAVAYLVLFRLLVRTRSTHRGQALVVAVGALLPFLANVAYYLGATPHPGVDVTPLAFALSGIVFGWGLFQYDFLSVMPVASDVLVDELPDPVLVLDEDDRIVDHNAAAAAALDLTDVPDEHVADVAPGLLNYIERDDTYSLPEAYVTDGGSTQFYDPRAEPLDDQYGTVRGRLVVLRDVTGQQRRQERLEALQTATQQFISAATHEQIAQFTVDFVERALDRHTAGVFLVDDDETALEPAAVTDYVREYYDDEALTLGRDTRGFESFETGERVVQSLNDDTPFRQIVVFPMGEHGVLGIGTRDEEPMADDDEQFAAILARTTQVALSQVDRESALRQSRASVERRSEQIAFFNGVLRHTLRNALLVIQGRADHLDDHVDAEHRRHLDVIDRWCDDLTTLSDEIRSINDTVTATECERLDVVDLTGLLYESGRTAEHKYDVTVSMNVADGLSVHANGLADRVLESVVENAIEHNDADEPRVEIRTRRAADRVQVHVGDNGPGMSDELKGTVFERDLATNQTATGFGLYFVSVIMNLYGGTVWFEDNDPRGTVAVLEFQAADETPGDVGDASKA